MSAPCSHCKPLRDWAQANGRMYVIFNGPRNVPPDDVNRAAGGRNYGDCDCYCHDAHRMIMKGAK